MSRYPLTAALPALAALGALAVGAPAQAQTLYIGTGGYIEKYTHDGADLGIFYKNTLGSEKLGQTSGLTVDSTGNLLVISDPKYGIVKISSTGTYLASFGIGTAYNALATDLLGNVYAASNIKHTIDMFSPTGTALGTFAALTPGALTYSGLAFDKTGSLYVSTSLRNGAVYGTYTNSITKYAPDGTSLGVFAVPNKDYGTNSLAFNSAGNLFLGQFNEFGRSSAFQQFSATGTNLGRFSVGYGVYDPIQMAFDASDNLFVDDNGSVLEYNPAGAVIGHNGNIYLNLGISASGLAFATSPAAVPEMSTTVSLGLLLMLGLSGLTVSRRRRAV